MSDVFVLHRNRPTLLSDATVTPLAGNALELVMPRDGVLAGLLKRPVTLEDLDKLEVMIGDASAMQVLGAGEDTTTVRATVLM